MLIRFSVTNYRSFRDTAVLDMTATRLTSGSEALDSGAVYRPEGREPLLKAAAIYGANASGKSNLIRALLAMRTMILNSVSGLPPGAPQPADPFRLIVGADAEPSAFEIELLHEGVGYRYGFECRVGRIHAEWLYRTRRREARLFLREGQTFDIAKGFPEGKGLEARTRPDALFLSVAAQFNGPIASDVSSALWDFTVVSGLDDVSLLVNAMMAVGNTGLRGTAMDLIASFDTAILGVSLRTVAAEGALSSSNGVPADAPAAATGWTEERLMTRHTKRDLDGSPVGAAMFDLVDAESDGTSRLVLLAPAVADALADGKTLVIDEFDARLHPRLTEQIIGWFNSSKTNPLGAQLIVATHDIHLLSRDVLRRDQVWFTEKDTMERSRLYSLAEFRPRKEDLFERHYMLGRYGAVPVLGDLSEAVRAAPSA